MTARGFLLLAALTALGPGAPLDAIPGVAAARPRRSPADTLRMAPAEKARLLHRWAEEELDDPSVEARQRAMRDLGEAIRLDPDDARFWLTLARVQQGGGFDRDARASLDRAVRLAPRNPRAYLERGRAWKREWVRWIDSLAFDRAIADFDTVIRLRPAGAEGWLALVPMRYESGDLSGAWEAAERALASRPRIVEAGLAAAYTSYRMGNVERADSLFRVTIPKLSPGLAALFGNVAPILGAENRGDAGRDDRRPAARAHGSLGGAPPVEPSSEVGDSTASRTITEEAWLGLDVDPTTDVNETQLEFWSRVAHAWFVFWDPLRPGLDSRADLYIRYGPPRQVELNPDGVPLSFQPNALNAGTRGPQRRARSELSYPMGVVRWNYPELGMGVVLNDRSLMGRFEPAVSRGFMPGQVPNPAILARRGDLLSLGEGRAVFPTQPPGPMRLELAGAVAGFEGDAGPQLFAQVLARGAPDDALTARWVVQDSSGRTVTRGEGPLGVSGCDPAERQLGEVAQVLPPGSYRLAISVRNERRHRGLYRATLTLPERREALAMSDVVLTCGDPALAVGRGSVRIDANVDGRVRGASPVAAYFEIYRLAPDAGGQARFEIEYAVRRLRFASLPGERRRRREPVLLSSTSREEAQAAGLRRQFVTVPVLALAPGRYQLEIRVRDLVSGTQVERAVAFDRE